MKKKVYFAAVSFNYAPNSSLHSGAPVGSISAALSCRSTPQERAGGGGSGEERGLLSRTAAGNRA